MSSVNRSCVCRYESAWSFFALRLVAYSVVCIALAPVLYVLLWTFWGTPVVGVLSASPTMQWVEQFFRDASWLRTGGYSLVVAALVATSGTAILVCFFYFARFGRGRPYWVSYALMMAFLVSPPTLLGLALRLFGGRFGLSEMVLLYLGQLVLVFPVQYFVLDSVQVLVPTEMLFAATTLGASHRRNLWYVYWPLLRRASIAAWGVGFLVSLDELVIALMVIDSSLVTVPQRLWEQIPRSMDPIPAVVGTVLVLASILGIVVALSLQILDVKQRRIAFREDPVSR